MNNYDEQLLNYLRETGRDYSYSNEDGLRDLSGNPMTRESALGSNTRANQILNGQSGYYRPTVFSPIDYRSRTNVPDINNLQQMGQDWQRQQSLYQLLQQLLGG